MDRTLIFELVVCGLCLGGLSLLAEHLQPGFPRSTLVAGLGGGSLCVVWGLLAGRRWWGRLGAMLTLTLMAAVFARQAVHDWGISSAGTLEDRKVAVLITVMTAFCLGLLVNLARIDQGN